MLLVFLILLVVTVCVAIVASYFLLNAENYHWQWTTFGASASTALYVFLYSIHYFVFKTRMNGFFQTAFYFGCAALLHFDRQRYRRSHDSLDECVPLS